MRFDSPQFLPLIPAFVAAMGLLYLWVRRRKARLLARFGSPETVGKLTRGVSSARQHWKFAFVVAALALVLFALSRPQYGAIERPLRRRGVEVLIAIDCSASMLSRDIEPSRLERARQQLRGLIRRLGGDDAGIIAFAGIPIVQCPLTSDYDMAINLFDSIDADTVPVGGTAIGSAIRKAAETFRGSDYGHKVLVLLTDGEDHESDPIEAAREAAKQGIRIYSIGIGSVEGAPIPLPEGGFKETKEGGKVNSRLDFQTLSRIAAETGGKAIKANSSGDLEIKEIAGDIDALLDRDLHSTAMTIYAERYQYFLALAIVFLLAEMLLGERRRRVAAHGAGRFD
ncbi:VWA domain-containing protein [Candidatus Sumerlaeota bacterium]|nr:VWA domain-containing protein [Candidatus Sumerlaeota bacterium]